MNLFLDDIREAADAYEYMHHRIGDESLKYQNLEWQVVRNYDQFVKWINDNGMPDLVSFDHDLADEHYEIVCACGSSEDFPEEFEEETGHDCVLYLIEYAKDHPAEKFPEVMVHSMNPYGSERIHDTINRYNKNN
jgi:hypothetical protein